MVSAQGRTFCVLIRRRNSSLSCSMALVVLTALHWAGSRCVKQKEPLTRFFQTVGNRGALETPFSQEDFTTCLDLSRAMGIDHVPVACTQFLMHGLGSIGQ